MKINFAHRGSLTEAPENTVLAMEKALASGARALELDVQLTKDGQLVVIHDHHFARFNHKVKSKVKDVTLAEAKQIDIGSGFSNRFKDVRIATLGEVLEAVPKDILLNVEIKNIPIIYDGIERKVLATLEEYERLDQTIISSFDHEALQKVQQMNADIPLGMLFYYRMIKPWKYAQQTGLNIYSVHPLYSTIDLKFVEAFRDLGMKIYPFTVNTMVDYEAMMELGVDGVFSNNPAIFGVAEERDE